MSERKSLSGGDWVAIGTFLIGTLVAVLMAYGLSTGLGGTAGTGALAAAIAGSIGPLPALIGGVGIALLGARGFLMGERRGLASGILGVIGVAIGLAVVAGSLSAARGGSLGAGTGGRIAELTHPGVGILLGAVVAFGAAYFAWMREDPAAAAKLAPARRATPAPPKGDDGVTAAESAMLFPDERAAAEAAPARAKPAPVPVAVALYPEDVRLKGQIPPGTAPLGTANGASALRAIPATAEPAVYRWTAPRTPVSDPTHVAHEEIEALADEAPPIPAPAATFAPADEAEPEFDAALDEELDRAVAEADVEEIEASPLPPRPSWETTGLDEDDEPVDAYGTPLSLVERARLEREADLEADEAAATLRIPREIGDEEEFDADALLDEVAREDDAVEVVAVEEIAVEEVVEEVVAVAADEPVVVVASPEEVVPEVVAAAEEPESLLDVLRAHNAAVRAEAEAEVATEVLDEEELVAEDLEPEAEAPAVREPTEVQAEEPERTEVVAEDETLEVVAEAQDVEADDEDELEDELEEDSDEGDELEAALDDDSEFEDEVEEAEAQPEPTPVIAPAPAATKVEPAPKVAAAAKTPAAPKVAAAASLFDRVETESEPEVVLQPQAAVPASRAEKAPGRGIDPEKKLLVEVGCMFVERGRVAVSMLQRQYDMDFDQACRVLDDLQEMGLIGPYMGGKNRDILLSKEQWMEKVGVA